MTAVAELEGLMALYQQADATATTTLIHQVSPLLLRYFVNQCGNRSDAEDLLQDAWLRIHKARHTYRPAEPLLPWLYAIARHVRVDGYRRSAVEARLSIFRAIREGRLAKVTDTVETVLGRKPIAFGQWATENAGSFR